VTVHFHDGELAVGLPFDYANSTLVYLSSDIPEPNQPGYQGYVEEAIVDVARALGGRTMVLFTSYAQLNRKHLRTRFLSTQCPKRC
jgi:DNA polymerase-3 subunit epsilon/ATP-dependent DNA helicase DinG